ncbi:peroxiredoxin-like 2C isoform X1 [Agelaius phoeniceus]|uniref:peroxiredoxin-like 2C isoform X1 n=1 Tax=Agelaius phoeniceus TaxID=39638 RepID=UPI004054B0B3
MSLLLLAHHSWKLRVTLLCFPGTNCTPSLADGRAAGSAAGCSLSPSESPASSWASARLPEVAPPAGSERLRSIPGPSLPRRRTTARAFPLQLRLSLPRSHGRVAGAPGHAAGRAGAGLRAAAGAGAAAGGRPLPGAGRGRQERPLPGPNFLCYTCKEYVEDLAKVPKAFLQESNVRLIVIGQSSYHHIKPFCSLTGYTHEIYVDPQREIYKILGMKRGEGNKASVRSPHVKSNTLLGSIRSIWRAMTGPAFDFQGDPAQQGGALILGPGNEVHFLHLDKNRLDHVPINTILELAGVKTVNFSNKPQIIDI